MPTCSILNVSVADTDSERLVSYTEANLERLRGQYICAANVHTTVMASENAAYMQVYDEAAMIIPDGGPLASIGRKRGCPGMRRTPGPDYMEEMLKRGYRHFFYGSKQETLDKMKSVIETRFPKATICGMYSPPFRKMTKEEDREAIDRINRNEPDFIWVGLGAPKQEMWMCAHKGKVNGLMVGVGAAFDYLAGNIKRAPEWMQRNNLEWLYRLKQEPGRLFGRYMKTNVKFVWDVVLLGK